MDIGIDLGTTYSVIAVKGQRDPAGDYPQGQYLPECGVTVIPSPFGELTIPSAYWQNPDDPSEVLVGSDAKEGAKDGATPILFSKRKIGTTEVFRLGNTTLTAEDVAAKLLRYLKECAEKYLGEPVRRAVVTHPAYFDRNQVEETRKAAESAGLDMSVGDEQMIMEPAAAALSFIQDDPRDPLRVLIYDLGGGTFDVTILERREGVTTMLAFDGDPLLGGYNFDRLFVEWLLQRLRKTLKEAGRTLTLDPENSPEDMSRWTQLLQLAERVKEELTRQHTDKMPVRIKANDILVDDDGKPVMIQDRITRYEYARIGAEVQAAELVSTGPDRGEGDEVPALSMPEYIQTTIRSARNAISKAGFTEEQIDLGILVGGSTQGQWIQEAVSDALSCEAMLHFSPDMCVAAGAALQAANLPPASTGEGKGIEIVPDVGSTSLNPSIMVTGTIRRDDGSELDAETLASYDVLLHLPEGGHTEPVKAGQAGVVIFEDIELLEDEPSSLRFEVVDQRGGLICDRSFQVLYEPSGGDGGITILPVVPKPLYLPTASGMVLIADEGEELPTPARRIVLEQLHDEDTLQLELFQGDHKVTTIELKDLPEDVGAGSEIILEVKLTKRNVMQGIVKILRKFQVSEADGYEPAYDDDDEGRVAASMPVKIPFPPIVIPEKPELLRKLKDMEARRQELLQPEITPDAERRTQIGGEGGKVIRAIKALLSETLTDRQEVYEKLLALERLLNPVMDAMTPPLTEFNRRLAEVRDLIAGSAEGNRAESWSKDADKIERDGLDAYYKRSKRGWGNTFQRLEGLVSEVEHRVGPPPPPPDQELPETEVLKLIFVQQFVEPLKTQYRTQLAALQHREDYKTKLRARGVEIEGMIKKLQGQIEAVSDDTDREQARAMMSQYVALAQRKIEEKVEEWKYDHRRL